MTLKPPSPGANLAPGYRLDRYELLAPIAQGGMASVWIARQTGKHGFEKLVAIKTILPQYANDVRFQTMFLDEAHIAAGIEHVNVAQILDLGEEHDVLYIVMEFVDGDALSKINRACEKRATPIPPGVLLRVLADACGGLHAAHELRAKDGSELHVVHRDVSPQNILVSNKGVAKVIDFGIAKARDRAAGETGTGLLKGKIHYMPPEQALGKAVDRRADVWAVGAILYHLLANRLPFDAENQLGTLHLLTSGRPPIPLPPHVPAPIKDVVRRAMAFDVDKRFATCAEFQRAIEDAMALANCRATTHDVASFLTLNVGDRQEQRKQAIELALKAAADRKRMQSLLKPPSADSSSGLSNVDVQGALRALSSSGLGSEPGGPPGSSSGTSPHGVSSPSMTSNATLGSAAVETPLSIPGIEPAARRRRALVFAGAGLGAVAVVLVAILAGRGRSTPTPASGGETTEPPKPHVEAHTEPTETARPAPTAPPTATQPTADPSASAEPTAKAPPPLATIKPGSPWPKASAKPPSTAAPTATVKKKVDDGF